MVRCLRFSETKPLLFAPSWLHHETMLRVDPLLLVAIGLTTAWIGRPHVGPVRSLPACRPNRYPDRVTQWFMSGVHDLQASE